MLYGAKPHLYSGGGGTVTACALLLKPASQHKLAIELRIAKYHKLSSLLRVLRRLERIQLKTTS